MIINKINFPIYGIVVITSVLIGMIYVYKMLVKENIEKRNILLYFIMYISFTITFAKIYTIITNGNEKNFITAGMSSYGGAIGIIIAALIFEKILPSNNKITKYSIISLPLIYSLSKIACFIVGCCHGIPYDGFLSVTYPHISNTSYFPIQILETIVFFIVFLIIHKLRNNKNIIYITIIISSISKFLLDFLRDVHSHKVISINQICSIVLLLIVVTVWIYKKKKN